MDINNRKIILPQIAQIGSDIICFDLCKSVLSVVLFIALNFALIAQEKTLDDLLKQKIESIAENQTSEDIDYSALQDQLNYYRIHPLNINKASVEQLKDLLILNDIQINNLVEHIRKNGELLTVYELQSIDGFDLNTIQTLMPFISLSKGVDKTSMKKLLTGNNQLDLRWQRVIEEQKGYENVSGNVTKYLGSPDKLLFRYRYNSNNRLLFGLTGEKDPGEQFFNGAQKQGFDFYSGYIMLNDRGILKSLVVGDYQLFIGQGLMSWTGLAFSKSVDVLNLNKTNVVFRPHTSMEENLFLRGVAASLKFGKVELATFASRKAFDGNILDTTTSGEILTISSLQQSGYHTTTSEVADKHASLITTAGSDLSYKSRCVNIGAAFIHTIFSTPVVPTVQLYNLFDFKNKQINNVGMHFNFLYRNINFFGEATHASNNSYAYVTGILIALDKKLSTSLLYRNYSKNYYSLYANGFADNSTTTNEHGIYAGFVFKPIEKITVNAYYDLFSFPWLKYQVNAPSIGHENFVQLNYNPDKKFECYIRYRRKLKEANTYTNASIDYLVPVAQDNYRIYASFHVTKWLRLANRIEYVVYDRPDGKRKVGILMYQDVALKVLKGKGSVMLRYTLFDADDYYGRVYAFENDMPNSFSIPSFYNQGARYYVMLNYDITKNSSIWLRYSQTNYSNVNVISKGTLNEIQGNTKSEVKLQLQLRF